MKFKTFRTVALGGAVALGAAGVYLALHRAPAQHVLVPAPAAPAQPSRERTPPPPTPAPVPAPTPTAAPAPVAAPQTPDGLRPMDQEILAFVHAGMSGDKLTDAFPRKPYKVNLYRDGGGAGVSRLKIDLDRDGKWDEKWTLAPDGRVKRQVAPADDESYTESYLLDGASWARKDK
jgi:hypothetical protein